MLFRSRHLIDRVPISNLCDEFELQPTQLYDWLKRFFENGHTAFDNGRQSRSADNAKDQKIEKLEAKLQRKDYVLAELMEEHVSLKGSSRFLVGSFASSTSKDLMFSWQSWTLLTEHDSPMGRLGNLR